MIEYLSMKINIDEIKSKVLPVLEKASVTRAAIFGSYVRNEEREDMNKK